MRKQLENEQDEEQSASLDYDDDDHASSPAVALRQKKAELSKQLRRKSILELNRALSGRNIFQPKKKSGFGGIAKNSLSAINALKCRKPVGEEEGSPKDSADSGENRKGDILRESRESRESLRPADSHEGRDDSTRSQIPASAISLTDSAPAQGSASNSDSAAPDEVPENDKPIPGNDSSSQPVDAFVASQPTSSKAVDEPSSTRDTLQEEVTEKGVASDVTLPQTVNARVAAARIRRPSACSADEQPVVGRYRRKRKKDDAGDSFKDKLMYAGVVSSKKLNVLAHFEVASRAHDPDKAAAKIQRVFRKYLPVVHERCLIEQLKLAADTAAAAVELATSEEKANAKEAAAAAAAKVEAAVIAASTDEDADAIAAALREQESLAQEARNKALEVKKREESVVDEALESAERLLASDLAGSSLAATPEPTSIEAQLKDQIRDLDHLDEELTKWELEVTNLTSSIDGLAERKDDEKVAQIKDELQVATEMVDAAARAKAGLEAQIRFARLSQKRRAVWAFRENSKVQDEQRKEALAEAKQRLSDAAVAHQEAELAAQDLEQEGEDHQTAAAVAAAAKLEMERAAEETAAAQRLHEDAGRVVKQAEHTEQALQDAEKNQQLVLAAEKEATLRSQKVAKLSFMMKKHAQRVITKVTFLQRARTTSVTSKATKAVTNASPTISKAAFRGATRALMSQRKSEQMMGQLREEMQATRLLLAAEQSARASEKSEFVAECERLKSNIESLEVEARKEAQNRRESAASAGDPISVRLAAENARLEENLACVVRECEDVRNELSTARSEALVAHSEATRASQQLEQATEQLEHALDQAHNAKPPNVDDEDDDFDEDESEVLVGEDDPNYVVDDDTEFVSPIIEDMSLAAQGGDVGTVLSVLSRFALYDEVRRCLGGMSGDARETEAVAALLGISISFDSSLQPTGTARAGRKRPQLRAQVENAAQVLKGTKR